MTTVADVRLALVEVLNTVPNIGNVYDHYKYSSDWQHFLDQFAYFGPSGKKGVRGAWISIPTVRTGRMSTFDTPTDALDWPLRFVMSFSDKDGTEAEFEDVLYTARDVLRTQLTLALGGDIIVPGSIFAEIPLVDLRMYGSVLCSYAEMSITMEVEAEGLVNVTP